MNFLFSHRLRVLGLCAVSCSIATVAQPVAGSFTIRDASIRLMFYDGWFRAYSPWSCQFLRYSSNVPKKCNVMVADWGAIDPDSFYYKMEFMDTIELGRRKKEYRLRKSALNPSDKQSRRCYDRTGIIGFDSVEARPTYDHKGRRIVFRISGAKGYEHCFECVQPLQRGHYRIRMVAIHRRTLESVRSAPAVLKVR